MPAEVAADLMVEDPEEQEVLAAAGQDELAAQVNPEEVVQQILAEVVEADPELPQLMVAPEVQVL
jgi:hypothetical protein